MGFGAKGMSSVAFNQFWKERVEKEEAEIVNGSAKAAQNETVVIQSPLGVSVVRTYAQHRHKSSLRGSAAFVRTARDKKQQGDKTPSISASRAASEAGSKISRMSGSSSRSFRPKQGPRAPSLVSVSSIASGDRPPIKEITIPIVRFSFFPPLLRFCFAVVVADAPKRSLFFSLFL